jgi:hypothetical protein
LDGLPSHDSSSWISRKASSGKTLKRNKDGSLTLYAGAKSPGADKETNWLTAPEEPFSLYIRAYWGKKPIIDGSWQPPRVEKLH